MRVKSDEDHSLTHGVSSEKPLKNRFLFLEEFLQEVAQNEAKLLDLLDEKSLRKLADPSILVTTTLEARAKALRREKIMQTEMESLRAVVASLRSQIAVLEDALAEARRKEMGDIKGRFEIEDDEEADDGSGRGVQTCISGSIPGGGIFPSGISDNAGFFMAWTPRSEPDDPVDGFKIELDVFLID
ncbi:hypothetical protein Pmar_PMAR007132 [Perkinsus marinus ATCC 50983]|uniref:Uncharacterized protein n=1 Tax=Perkinsus marinus (strain ATCC 50983 / TXsc) TaxID=423536 RepID=C5KQA7_PERM5|nr:hypothetical protein Pmar_PMAR007132 [Perkinsus marinus ATCC 50983]EER13329.1 hypothetical protein Pmar_PMAR007132 [Perkinsus marinus ATCC 50983]|eukprot:XP_002781534.1 hypothetical protein Pmar_PMAR007132 [Perkinsus marinus ATCC 50983]